MNSDLQRLHNYPFEKLALLKNGAKPPRHLDHIALSIGEPRHPTPSFIAEELLQHLHGLSNYPTTRGSRALREAVADWLGRRYSLPPGSMDPERNILPVNGTREALFAFAQTAVRRSPDAVVVMPNPFYQIYEGAAILSGATPFFLPTSGGENQTPNLRAVPDHVWNKCQLLYICSPGNPTGAVMSTEALQDVIGLSHKHDFIIASDECYSELYLDEDRPPCGLLQAAAALGNTTYERCIVFNSLSKRSNAPGLRSGFVAGDQALIDQFYLYRTYHGCAMPLPTQYASAKAWQDEHHVVENRALYRAKFQVVLDILGDALEVSAPEGGFYLWPKTPIPDTEFALRLFEQHNVTVLPGRYLSREQEGQDPGLYHVRIALVAPLDECVDAANRIVEFIESL